MPGRRLRVGSFKYSGQKRSHGDDILASSQQRREN